LVATIGVARRAGRLPAGPVTVRGARAGWPWPGGGLVTVKTGTITFYMGDDPSCSAHVHPAGTTFFENGGMVGMARNEGTV